VSRGRNGDLAPYRALRIAGAGLSILALVLGGYPVAALTTVILLGVLVSMTLRSHPGKDDMVKTLQRWTAAVLAWFGWTDEAHRLSPAHAWLLPTPAFLRAARARTKDQAPPPGSVR
jgi:hypothetical protein